MARRINYWTINISFFYSMNALAKMFEPSKDRLMSNAKRMMETTKDPWFKQYWQKVYVHLCRQYKKLH